MGLIVMRTWMTTKARTRYWMGSAVIKTWMMMTMSRKMGIAEK